MAPIAAIVIDDDSVVRIINDGDKEDNGDMLPRVLDIIRLYTERIVNRKLPAIDKGLLGFANNAVIYSQRVVLMPLEWRPDMALIDDHTDATQWSFTPNSNTCCQQGSDYTIARWDGPVLGLNLLWHPRQLLLAVHDDLSKADGRKLGITIQCHLWYGLISKDDDRSFGRTHDFCVKLDWIPKRIGELLNDEMTSLLLKQQSDAELYRLYLQIRNISRNNSGYITADFLKRCVPRG